MQIATPYHRPTVQLLKFTAGDAAGKTVAGHSEHSRFEAKNRPSPREDPCCDSVSRLQFPPMASEHLRAFFLPLVRRAFGELRIGDREVVEYVSGVVADFARADQLHRLRAIEGKPVDSVVEMLGESIGVSAARARIEWQREVRKYIGDYTLFMSGIFRAHVSSGGYFDYYLLEGSRSYRTVSELDLSLYRSGFMLFQQLSQKFEFYSGALDYLRKAYFAPTSGHDPFAEFLRQVEGWVRIGISNN